MIIISINNNYTFPHSSVCSVASLFLPNSTKIIFGNPLILLLVIGGMLRFMAGYAIGSYLPDFYSQIYPSDNTTCKPVIPFPSCTSLVEQIFENVCM